MKSITRHWKWFIGIFIGLCLVGIGDSQPMNGGMGVAFFVVCQPVEFQLPPLKETCLGWGRKRPRTRQTQTRRRNQHLRVNPTLPEKSPSSHAPKAMPDPPVAVIEVGSTVDNTEAAIQTWVAEEMASVDLKDKRLNKRLCKLVTQFAQNPTLLIPQACGDWAGAKAAYRFLDNQKVTHANILAAHRQRTVERIAAEPEGTMTLVLQDTTSLDYTHHPQTQGLGALEHPDQRGFLMHNALAVSEDGVPLGLLDQQIWTRDPATVGKRHQRKQHPIEGKESYKWVQGMYNSLEDVATPTCLITVADREADVFELFQEAKTHQTGLLVRSSWNRRLEGEKDYVHDAVRRAPVQDTFTIAVRRAPDRPPRLARVDLRFAEVTLRPPSRPANQQLKLHPVTLTIIEVREEQPPSRQEALHWLLLTNQPMIHVADARRYVRWYELRWLVERYHYVLKSGCRIEARQLRNAASLRRCLGIDAIVAWRLLWLTYQARATPDAPCTVALETHEWQALYCYRYHVKTPPEHPPTLDQAVRWIAQLGGFLGRAGDGQPGAHVIWRGWQRLHDIATTWQLAHSPPRCG